MIKYLYQFLLMVFIPLSMINGALVIAPLILFFGIGFIYNFKKMDFSSVKDRKIEMSFFIWLLMTCFWSLDHLLSVQKLLFLSFIYITLTFALNIKNLEQYNIYKVFANPVNIGIFLSVAVFIIEFVNNGILTKEIQSLFNDDAKGHFVLYFLDHGCAALSILVWPAFFITLRKKKYTIFILMFMAVYYVLNLSDNPESYMAFLLGFAVFLLSYYSRMLFGYLLIGIISISLVAIPYFSAIQSPEKTVEEYKTLSDSTKHRIFISNFVIDKYLEKPFLGWGLASSSMVPIDEENDVIYYEQYKWHPLPLHPHNIILQILLETGAIGLLLFAIIIFKYIHSIIKQNRESKDYLWGSLFMGFISSYFIISSTSFDVWQTWWVLISAVNILLFRLYSNIKKVTKHKELQIRG